MSKVIEAAIATMAGTGLCLGSVFHAFSTKASLRSWTLARGKVVGFNTNFSESSPHRHLYAPILRYEDSAGRVRHFESGSYSSKAPCIGDEFELYFDPAAPSKAIMKGFWNTYMGHIIAMILGLFLLGCGVLAFFLE